MGKRHVLGSVGFDPGGRRLAKEWGGARTRARRHGFGGVWFGPLWTIVGRWVGCVGVPRGQQQAARMIWTLPPPLISYCCCCAFAAHC